MSFWNVIWKTPTTDWVYGLLAPTQVNHDYGEQRVVKPNTGYAHVMLRTMRVPYSRKGWKAHSAATHCFSQLQYGGDARASFHSLATPAKLRDLDPAHAPRIELRDARLLGPVPYRGGDLTLELGLFSIQTDLAAPYLALLGKVAEVSGVGFVTRALALADVFRDGIERLHSQADACLEVGVTNTFSELRTGCYVLVGASTKTMKLADLRVDAGTLMHGATPVTEPHLVFSIEATTGRDDFATIPDLGEAYVLVQKELRRFDRARIAEAFGAFRVRAMLSHDLLIDDARRIVADVKTIVDAVLDTSAPHVESAVVAPELAAILERNVGPAGEPIKHAGIVTPVTS
jgi:hypothetical protein